MKKNCLNTKIRLQSLPINLGMVNIDLSSKEKCLISKIQKHQQLQQQISRPVIEQEESSQKDLSKVNMNKTKEAKDSKVYLKVIKKSSKNIQKEGHKFQREISSHMLVQKDTWEKDLEKVKEKEKTDGKDPKYTRQ